MCILQIDQARLGMRSRNFLIYDKYASMRDAYIRYGKNVAVLFGADPDVAEADMRNILSLEIELANVIYFVSIYDQKYFCLTSQSNND